MDGDWVVQLLTRHSTDYHPRGPNKFLWNGTVYSMTWPSSPSKLLVPNCCAVSSNCRNIRGWSQSSDMDWWLVGVYNLVKDDIKSIDRKLRYSCQNREAWVTALYSCLIWRESENYLPQLHPQIPLTKWNDLSSSPMYETMSLIRATKQNPKHNRVTRKWIISYCIPSRGKPAKPIGGVVNDCRVLKIMQALLLPQFRHSI